MTSPRLAEVVDLSAARWAEDWYRARIAGKSKLEACDVAHALETDRMPTLVREEPEPVDEAPPATRDRRRCSPERRHEIAVKAGAAAEAKRLRRLAEER